MILSCCIGLLAGCSDGTDTASDKDVKNGKTEAIKPETSAAYTEQLPAYLEQNWNDETRMQWWYTSQGSRLLPLDWFLALEKPDSNQLLGSKENLSHYRFITWPADAKWNPDGLPVGFVADTDVSSGGRYLGFTCAACHTGLVAYKNKQYLIEGAPAHHDFDGFITEVAKAMQKTAEDGDKFNRFALRVLGAQANNEQVQKLKADLTSESGKQMARVNNNLSAHPNGYARLDAFGSIFNEVVVTAINEPGNAKPANAPVSYPMLWDTPQHDQVQWNGSAVNAGIGAYVRNTGEVVGVYGGLNIQKNEAGVLSFNNHINVKNLQRLESILATLWSPLWPDKFLPALEQAKVKSGEQLYQANCSGCHKAIKRDDPGRTIEAQMLALTEIGTDPTMATNVVTRISKTGIIQGQTIPPLCSATTEQFAAEGLSLQLVRFGVGGVLRTDLDPLILKEGFPEFLAASKKAACKDNCDPLTDATHCVRLPGYKARPLNGIWASAPYLHNGSVPNLWELLQKPELRTVRFNAGSWEYDPVKVGFETKAEPATSELDTQLPGNSNKGHDYGTNLTDAEKWDLIEYLKSL